jgi:hypothetical protein
MATRFDGKVYEVTATQMMAQMTDARRWQAEAHTKLIAAGFIWDGMDGYTTPASMSVDDAMQVIDSVMRRPHE